MMATPNAEIQGLLDTRVAGGRRVDRRHTHGVVDGELCVAVSWTETCSGCFEGGECMGLAHHYGYDDKAQCHIGAGCDECGYTGKSRTQMWMPAGMFYRDHGWHPDLHAQQQKGLGER